ncbi:MAG TPA: 30S ribosomal protein S3ae [archaeon]|nr:30S ribosomal protein S3ae [archaeon]
MALKKQWYEIISPKMFGEKVVNETLAADPNQLMGRTIEVSLLDFMNNYSRFFVKLKFQVEKINGSKVYTKFVGHSVMTETVYRMVQRRMRRVDVIQDVETKDGKKIKVKTLFSLVRRVNTATKSAARKKVFSLVDEEAKNMDFEDFINSVIKGDLQKKLKRHVSKIYPVGQLEIRKTEVL